MTAEKNIHVPYLVDETLREGVERCPFAIAVDTKLSILEKMVDAGIREFVVGCGPEEPEVWLGLHHMRDSGKIAADTSATFIILLNCWETAFDNFKRMPREYIESTVFSFGMITHKEDENCFERAVDAFASLGATQFKASILNNFKRGIGAEKYQEMHRQITKAKSLGVKVIRINDSVGTLLPSTTRELCRALVADFPDTPFCLHAHNDRGLAVANTLESIHAGFTMVEGALCGYGNRSGITPIEQLNFICQEQGIQLGHIPLDHKKLVKAAQFTEEAFLLIPNIYRPVSGIWEKHSNFGVLNIPNFIEADGYSDSYFINYPGLHPYTIESALKQHYEPGVVDETVVQRVLHDLAKNMKEGISEIEAEYGALREKITDFYRSSCISSKDVAHIAKKYIPA